MNLVEKVELRKIHYLNSLSFKEYKSAVNSSKKTDKDLKVLFDKMKYYCEELIKGKGEFKRTYHHTLNTSLEAGGRLFCGGSIQGQPKNIRGFLFGETTTDIDMKNAHPVICRYICRKYNIDCPNLEYYISNRDEILGRFPEKEIAKNAFLCALNDDKPCKKLDKYSREIIKVFKDFDKEIKEIQKKIITIEKYKECVNCVPSSRQYNFNGSAINRILCYEENKILQIILDKLATKEIELCALMFDGCMPYGNFYDDKDLLSELCDAINSHEDYKDLLNIELTYKEHSNDIVIPIDFVAPDEKENKLKGLVMAFNEKEASEIIFEKIKPRLICYKTVIWFRDEDFVWKNNEKTLQSFVRNYSANFGLYTLDKDDNPIEYMTSCKTITNVCKLILDIATMKNSDDEWLNNAIGSTLGKILFTNGYYDFHKSLFLPLDNLDDKLFFFEKINYDFSYVDETAVNDIRKRFFTDPLGEACGKYFSMTIARGLAGDAVKRFIFCVGSGNTGKSTLTQAIENSCSGYFGTFNAGCLAYRDTSSDEAQQLRWLMLLITKRIIISNEIKSSHKLDANAIKKISSGGKDKIVARGHGGNESEFPFKALCIANMNDCCDIYPKDDALNNRIKSFTYTKVYTDVVENEEYELLADKNIENEIFTTEFKLAFINLLMNDYKLFLEKGEPEEPEEILLSKKDWFGIEKDACVNEFLKDFEFVDFTPDDDSYIKSAELEEWLDNKKLKITFTKFALDLKKYLDIHKIKYDKKYKKINKKTIMSWWGFKRIEEDT